MKPILLSPLFCLIVGVSHAADFTFFESKVRPLLIQRCYECHSHEKKIKGGLALDSKPGWQTGGDHGAAITPGDVEKSLLIKAIRYTDSELQMPTKAKLPAEEIAILEQWVKLGAPDPRETEAVVTVKKRVIDLHEGKKFWAFQPVSNPSPPQVRDTSWPLAPLDHFILKPLETKGIKPVRDADRHTWLRRVSLDLTGLPPTEADVRSFENDTSTQAFEHVVDRLLNSKAYGECWARHWLDLTGYADMMGTSNNVYAEHAWRYRDWLIAAFNADKPFDEFIREQIAGDLMPSKSVEDRAAKITATGFLMVGDIEIVNPDKAKMETDHIDSQMIKIGQTFMGMTLGCVRCHDHKFDPIGLEDYYGIAGMLRSSPSSHKMPDMGVWSQLNSTVLPETPVQLAARKKLEAENEQRIADWKAEQTKLTEEKADVVKQLAAIGSPADSGRPTDISKGESKPAIQSAGLPEPSPRDRRSQSAGDKEPLSQRRDELDARIKKLGGDIQHAEFFKDKTPRAFAMSDGAQPADMPIYVRGNPYAPSTVVPRGAVRVASWEKFPAIPAGQSGRLQLADWLADKRNPLTARVTVNRIWQKLFGTGLVPSVDYFGARGDLPTHPELLDHLATRFMQGGWSQKQFLRSLVLSRTYRLSSRNGDLQSPTAVENRRSSELDPENKLYWRMNRQRLDAEALRDSLLAISGELARDSGGPALVMEKAENCGALSLKGVNPPNYAHKVPRPIQEFERTIYLPVFRNNFAGPDRLRGQFDFIDPAMIAGQRNQTVVPTQSLFLLNNDLIRKRAFALAKSLLAAEKNDLARLETLWLRALNRPITSSERDEALALLEAVTPSGKPAGPVQWTELCHSLLASNEFVFRL
ncbi:MAG: PSD1 and planctomycete cytochrome C domain-containing protein [Verrucomicrobiaceae bacterium]|nr:PSD1 and planctomycete cytochrome C domain-containing protein [Verrucomicrobiaceae bacterium]